MADLPAQGMMPDPGRITTRKEFGDALTEVRVLAVLTVREVARNTKISSGTLSGYFTGRHLPRRSELVAVLAACDVDDPVMVRAWVAALWRLRPRAANTTSGRDRDISSGVPFELPPDVRGFTGRGEQLAALDRLLSEGSSDAATVVVITGTAGVGKTALATRWIRRIADDYPDGCLFIDMRGYSPEPEQPRTAGDALAVFLRKLGVQDAIIPVDVAERQGHYRTLTNDRRLLVVLDNAATVDHVRPLLVGGPGSLVVVTSRDRLPGLVARDGAHRIGVDLFDLNDAIGLLRALIGERVDTELVAAELLAHQCAYLPLALRLASDLACDRDRNSLEDLTRELAADTDRLDVFDAGDDMRSAIRNVLSWSHSQLPADAARMLWLLALHPGHTLDLHATAALADISLAEARRAMKTLTRVNLVHESHGRFDMHDLLRAYAAEHAENQLQSDRDAAVNRLLEFHLSAALQAAHQLFPSDRLPPPAINTGVVFPGSAQAVSWLEAEQHTHKQIIRYAARNSLTEYATALSEALWRHLDTYGHYADGLTIHGAVLDALTAGQPSKDDGTLRRSLGIAYWRTGQYQEAADHLHHAITLAQDMDDQVLHASALVDLANVTERLGYYEQALAYMEEAIDILHAQGETRKAGRALANMAVIFDRLGRYDDCLDLLRQALAIAEENNDRHGQAQALTNLGMAYIRLHRPRDSFQPFQRALEIGREDGDRVAEVAALLNYAGAYIELNQPDPALELIRPALAIAEDLGDPRMHAISLNGLGEAYQQKQEYQQALNYHEQALAIARTIHDTNEIANSLTGAAQALHGLGHHEQAEQHQQEARSLEVEL